MPARSELGVRASTGSLKVGDRVFGIVGGGGQAEFVVSHERMVDPIPANLDFVEAAAVPEAFLTAHDALLAPGGVRPGERVLVHAVGSGVGTAAVQVAHAMGCTVLGTSRTRGEAERAGEAAGAGLSRDRLVRSSRRGGRRAPPTDGAGVDVVIDFLGGPVLAGNLAAWRRAADCVLAVGSARRRDGGDRPDTLMLRKRLRDRRHDAPAPARWRRRSP